MSESDNASLPGYPVDPNSISAPETRIARLLHPTDGPAVNVYVQTFRLHDNRWYSDDPSGWPLLATVTPQSVRTYPRYLNNPTAHRYRSRQQAGFNSVLYVDFSDENLPSTAEEAVRQIEFRFPYKLFNELHWGYGLHKPLDVVGQVLGRVSPESDLVVVKGGETHVVDGHIAVEQGELDKLRRALNRVATGKNNDIAQRRRATVFNELVLKLDPQGSSAIARAEITEAPRASTRASSRMRREAAEEAISHVRDGLHEVASQRPEVLLQLKAEIELVTLRQMIQRFKDGLAANHAEPWWQAFFEANLFILTLIFATQVKLLHKQAHVGTENLDGSNSQIGDFLFGRLGGSLALVEIKRPGVTLMDPAAYRKNVLAPSKELAGSVMQVLSQQSQLRTRWQSHFTDNKTVRESRPEHIRCVVVAGRAPSSEEEKRSFDIFQMSSTAVDIYTYDDLLSKLELIEAHLSTSPKIPKGE